MRIILVEQSDENIIFQNNKISDQDMTYLKQKTFKSLLIEDIVQIDIKLWKTIFESDEQYLDKLQSFQMDLIYFQNEEEEEIIKRWIGRLSCKKQFTKIEIQSCNINDDFFSRIFKNYIEYFDISKCFNLTKFDFIFFYKNLRILKLDGTKVDNNFLIKLSNQDFIQNQLETISLGLCDQITDYGAVLLIRNCTFLKEIDFTWSKVIVKFEKNFYIYKTLIYNLFIFKISDQTIEEILKLKQLKKLNIGMCFYVKEKSLKKLFQSEVFQLSLCELNIAQSNININCVKSCRISNQLKSLKMYECKSINSNEINLFLKNFSNLTYLNISSTKADDQVFQSLSKMQKLETLISQKVNFSARALKSFMKDSPQLQVVDFSQNKLSQDFLSFLHSQNNLKQIDIRHSLNEKNQQLIEEQAQEREGVILISEHKEQKWWLIRKKVQKVLAYNRQLRIQQTEQKIQQMKVQFSRTSNFEQYIQKQLKKSSTQSEKFYEQNTNIQKIEEKILLDKKLFKLQKQKQKIQFFELDASSKKKMEVQKHFYEQQEEKKRQKQLELMRERKQYQSQQIEVSKIQLLNQQTELITIREKQKQEQQKLIEQQKIKAKEEKSKIIEEKKKKYEEIQFQKHIQEQILAEQLKNKGYSFEKNDRYKYNQQGTKDQIIKYTNLSIQDAQRKPRFIEQLVKKKLQVFDPNKQVNHKQMLNTDIKDINNQQQLKQQESNNFNQQQLQQLQKSIMDDSNNKQQMITNNNKQQQTIYNKNLIINNQQQIVNNQPQIINNLQQQKQFQIIQDMIQKQSDRKSIIFYDGTSTIITNSYLE